MATTSKVTLHPGSIQIDGQPLILLTSSLFYFRLPAAEWRSRMRTLRRLGYNAIDVYFPWNYHELAPGEWDFSGERDVRAFLQQAKDEGLWVVARPGPYICSEWDGGGLPAFLNVVPGLRLRDNSPQYLEAVSRWYEKIMPLIAEYQVDRGGTVALVQVENELDFYDCLDRPGYMRALRDMALEHGITVPLVACAGQGDLQGATGGVEGVVPTCNVYFEPRDPQLENRIRHYDGLLRQMGYPLCIVETNRSHTDLRRLIAGGAKLVGPYLQTGGTDFGFTTGLTNWGSPVSLMTSHYDLGGMVSPGGKVRPEGREAILLAKMLGALGPALALSTPVAHSPVPVRGTMGQALSLDGGGWLVGLPNSGAKVARVRLGSEESEFPVKTELEVAPGTCPFVLLDYPLRRWGIEGCLRYATAELAGYSQQEGTLTLDFAVDVSAEVAVDWKDCTLDSCDGWQAEKVQEGWLLWAFDSSTACAEITGQDGKRLVIRATSRQEAGDLEKAGLDGRLIAPAPGDTLEMNSSQVSWQAMPVDSCGDGWFTGARQCKPGRLHLEENGIYRGFGWYRSPAISLEGVQGLLVRSGSDVLSLYAGHQYLGTVAPGGGEAYLELPEGASFSGIGRLVVRAEIWGHANFDDHRMPSLRLSALRGMGGMVAVRDVENITPNWFYQHRTQALAEQADPAWPQIYFGGWSTTDEPSRGVYYRDAALKEGMDSRVLCFPGLQVTARVFVDGRATGVVNPLNPYVDISELTRSSQAAHIAVAVEQDIRRPAGQVVLYQGESIPDWEVARWDEAGLGGLANLDSGVQSAGFPFTMPGGAMAWLHATLPLSEDWDRGWDLQFLGQGVKVTAWVGSRLVGRIWLPSEMRPRMTAGADDRVVLPASWLREAGGQVHLLVEAVGQEGVLEAVRVVLEF